MNHAPDFHEDALVLISLAPPTDPSYRVNADPVFEGPLFVAIQYAVEQVSDDQKPRCTVQTITGDVYDRAAIEALHRSIKRGSKLL